MQLTEEQRLVLKAYILADPILGPKTSGEGTDYAGISAALNATAAPDFWCYRTSLSKSEVTDDPSPDATVFDWNAWIGRTAAEREGWRELFGVTGTVNCSKLNVRSAFDNIFSGGQAAAIAMRAHMAAWSRRTATLAEKVLAIGAGSTGSPATFGAEGTVGIGEIGSILS